MINPTEADLGRAVVYREYGDFPGRKIETGIITSFNDQYVFVRYGRSQASQATSREDLEFEFPGPQEVRRG